MQPSDIDRQTSENTLFLRLIAAFALVLFAGAVTLWARYGGTVFFDMMATAWSYCF